MFKTMSTILLVISLITPGYTSERYSSPDLSEYYQSLNQPDNPSNSCCGAGDAYYADKVKDCPVDASDCALIAIITDTRPDTFKLPDDKIINRPHVDPGTEVVIPKSKIRKKPIPNPTEHNIVFMNRYNSVLCWEPGAGI